VFFYLLVDLDKTRLAVTCCFVCLYISYYFGVVLNALKT